MCVKYIINSKYTEILETKDAWSEKKIRDLYIKYFNTYFGQYIIDILRVKHFNCPSRCATHGQFSGHDRAVYLLNRKKNTTSLKVTTRQ